MDRRSLIAGLTLVGALPIVNAQAQTSSSGTASMKPSPTMADMKPSPNMAEIKTGSQFFTEVLPRAELSLVSSGVANDMATNRNAVEFAGFEFAEAVGVNMVLKAMDITTPDMKASEMDLVKKLKSMTKGAAFDRGYIAFQLANHEYLRDLADAYLHNSTGASAVEEKHARHLAALMLGVFKEHVAICKRISNELGA